MLRWIQGVGLVGVVIRLPRLVSIGIIIIAALGELSPHGRWQK